MGLKLSKRHPLKQEKMAEASPDSSCQCSANSLSPTSRCLYCQPSTSSSGEDVDITASAVSDSTVACSETIGPRRVFRNLSLGRKAGKASRSEKLDQEKSNKFKLNWTFPWRLKAPLVTTENREPLIDLNRFNPNDYPIEDKDELARRERAREIAEGIEMEFESLPTCYRIQSDSSDGPVDNSTTALVEVSANGNDGSEVEAAAAAVAIADAFTTQSEEPSPIQSAGSSAALLEGLTVLWHRSLAIGIDSQRSWNVLTHDNLHFLAQHFHWHQHQQAVTGPQV